MTYRLNKTNGDLLVDLVDGQIDTSTTDITLVGRNYKGFGEFLNENYIKLLENFSNTSAPQNPISGQLWWDTGEGRLKIYDGTTFKSAGGPIVSNQQPQMVAGDLWIDNENNQLYFFDGSDLVLVGPEYNAGQQRTGFKVESVIDSNSVDRTVLQLFIGGILQGIFADATFRLAPDTIPGYPVDANDTATPKRQLVEKGFNPVSFDDFNFRGIADAARALVDDSGNEKTAANFIPSDANGFTTGSLRIKNSAGLSVGVGDTEYLIHKVVGNTTTIENQIAGSDFQIRARQGNAFVTSVYVDTTDSYLGIWNESPTVELDVTGSGKFSGNLTVNGNLQVEGDATYLNVSTLTVQDKNIELGLLDDSTEGNDATIDGAGIIVRSTDGSKDLTWEQTTSSWTSNQNFNLLSGNSYRIANSLVLDATTLGASVVNSSLTNLGTLTSLQVDDIQIDGITISRLNYSSGNGINIIAQGDINIDSQKITGVADPVDPQDVATKAYTDEEIATIPTYFSLDITGFTSPDPAGTNNGPINDVKAVLDTIAPVTNDNNGAIARIHCVSYASATVTGINVSISTSPNTSGTLTKSTIAVDSNGTQNESVIQDIVSSNTTSGAINLTPNRYTMTFTVASGAWSHTSTVNYPPAP